MNTPTTPSISSYRRIKAAGLDVKVNHHGNAFRVKLINGEEVVAHIDCARIGSLSAAGAMQKAVTNTFGPTSGFYKAMQQLADIAESTNFAGV